MFCPNCGAEVNGSFCTKCGTPINGGTNPYQGGTLLITRPSKFWGWAVKLNVAIDGTIYPLSAGQTLSFNLVPGVHVITYKIWCRREQRVDLNVVPGGNYSVVFDYDWLWGGFKVGKASKLQ